MRALTKTLLLTLLLVASTTSLKFIDNLKKKFSNIFIVISSGDPSLYQTKSDVFKDLGSDDLHSKNISKMVNDMGDRKILYGMMYNSLIMSMIQDCLATLMTNECYILMSHFENVLKDSLDNDGIIKNYVHEYRNLDKNVVNTFSCNFYDPTSMLKAFLTAPAPNPDATIEEMEAHNFLKLSIINFAIYLESDDIFDKYLKILAKSTIQLAHLTIAIHGPNAEITKMIKDLVQKTL